MDTLNASVVALCKADLSEVVFLWAVDSCVCVCVCARVYKEMFVCVYSVFVSECVGVHV